MAKKINGRTPGSGHTDKRKNAGDIKVSGSSGGDHGGRANYTQTGFQSETFSKIPFQTRPIGDSNNIKLGQRHIHIDKQPRRQLLQKIIRNQTKYCIGTVATGEIIEKSFFTTLAAAINEERSRRGNSKKDYRLSSFVKASEINSLRDGLAEAGYPAAQSLSVGTDIKAADINKIVTAIKAAGFACVANQNKTTCTCDTNDACTCNCNNCTCDCNYLMAPVCTCDCNYCTCDCNYCTCNCNYSCTCNCNYSDMRLKKDIKFVKVENGLNIYSFKYFWSKREQVGVMAQEILNTKYSNAVLRDEDGYYMVDYSKLPITGIFS